MRKDPQPRLASRPAPAARIRRRPRVPGRRAESGMSSASVPFPGSWRWEESTGPAAMEALAPAWDDLVRAQGLPFISGALWMRCFWDAFGDGNQALKILAAYENGSLVAIVPLRRTGRMLRIWSPVSNFHTPYVAFACERLPSRAGEAILDGFLGSSEVLDLGPVQPGAAVCARLMDA